MIKIHYDTMNQICISFMQGPNGVKRAWVQHRDGERDWAGTGRYINIVRCNESWKPDGNPTDFPIFEGEQLTDRECLIAFVFGKLGIHGAIVDETASRKAA